MAPRSPVFLAKARYRQRRLRDALRLLPILGAVLWLVPLLWPRGEGGQTNAVALIYMFVIWAGLVVLGAVFSSRLDPLADPDPGTQEAP